MSNKLIRAELDARLKAWAQAQNLPVAWEGVSFTKPSGPFVEVFLMPTVSVNSDVAGKRTTYLGTYQVNCWGLDGKGMGQLEGITDSLIAAFPMLPKAGAVSIEATPSAGRPIEDMDGWTVIPVRIKYRYESITP